MDPGLLLNLVLLLGYLRLDQALVDAQNVALNKAASQYTGGDTMYGIWPAGHAVDGIKQCGNIWWQYFTVSSYGRNPWWQVDLGAVYDINRIVVYGRTDGNHKEQLKGFQVYLSETPFAAQQNKPSGPPVYTNTGRYGNGIFEINLTRTTTARYCRLVNPKVYETIVLCEVEIFGIPNVALNKTTRQYQDGTDQWPAHNAVDGLHNCGTTNAQSFTLSNYGHNPWWQVDLGAVYDIYKIVVYGRADNKNTEQLQGFRIYLSETAFNTDDVPSIQSVYENTDYGDGIIEIDNINRKGRFCRLVNPYDNKRYYNSGPIVLCEVQIYGKQCAPNTYGKQCVPCSEHCKTNSQCDSISGHCLAGCQAGYKGDNCTTLCQRGHWGPNCSNSCGHCTGPSSCDIHNGNCPTGTCQVGYTGPRCDTCIAGKWGPNCQNTCGHCTEPNTCNPENGTCPGGTCQAGHEGHKCNTACRRGAWGPNCRNSCGHCAVHNWCDSHNGNCPTGACQPGFKGAKCNITCPVGTWGPNCVNHCGHCASEKACDNRIGNCRWVDGGTCQAAYHGERCNSTCTPGTWGRNCRNDCGHCTVQTSCDIHNGSCPHGTCTAGYKGPKCNTECTSGKWGPNCPYSCGHCAIQDSCNSHNGSCTYGTCQAGYHGERCNTTCSPGTWGPNCRHNCGHCSTENSCDVYNGSCHAGACQSGYDGSRCDTPCPGGSWGPNCPYVCGHCEDSTLCNAGTGACPDGKCQTGYKGTTCDTECEPPMFGQDCSRTCHCSNTTSCDHVTGACDEELCDDGWFGKSCESGCVWPSFGANCSFQCHCADNGTCDHVTGTCHERRCDAGWQGGSCSLALLSESQPQEQASSSVTAAVGGGVAAVIVIAAVVVAMVIYRRRRSRGSQTKSAVRVDKSTLQRAPTTEGNGQIYENHAYTEDVAEGGEYYSFTTNVTGIRIHQLWNHIRNNMKPSSTFFAEQFQELPNGQKYAHDVGKDLANVGKTRYKDMYAYDHSRVVLSIETPGKTDYINASYIDGYDKLKKFIASQGPTKSMIDDFWRMVWQENTEKIVMLTKLVEMATQKCLQYWPEEEGEVCSYGNINVELVNTETFPDYCIRTLEVRKANGTSRTIHQFHFTAWPDKDVPDNAWCIVNFWRAVQTNAISSAGPIVVHCSAGIGRTGTFIALDNLLSQAKTEGVVRPLQVVEALRRQRLNMVQTKPQYVYLHEALAEALYTGTHFIWARHFLEQHKYLMGKDPGSKEARLQQQFKLLVDGLQTTTEEQPTEDDVEYSNIAIEMSESAAYRPHLKNRGSDFIQQLGACFLPNCAGKNTLLVCVSPSEANLEEFWALVEEQHITTTIMLTAPSDPCYKVSSYLGGKLGKPVGKYTVNLIQEKTQKGFTEKSFSFRDNNHEDEEYLTTIKQFEYGGTWNDVTKTPRDVEHVLDLLDAIERWQPHITEAKPILIYSGLNDTRCGLLAVLLSELQRLKVQGGRLNVIESVKTMKERNQDVISNFDQYRCCYDVLAAHLRRTDDYENV